jgi:hypothetical protein
MKKYLLVAILLLSICSCHQTPYQKVNKNNLEIFFKSIIKETDSAYTLQSFEFIKLDTTTLANRYNKIYYKLLDQYMAYTDELEVLSQKLTKTKTLIMLSKDLDRTLYETYNDERKEYMKRCEYIFKQDSLIKTDLKRVDRLCTKADSVKPVGYVAKCLYSIRKNNQSVVKDTTDIQLDSDFNIIDNTEYSKILNNLYKPVSSFKF